MLRLSRDLVKNIRKQSNKCRQTKYFNNFVNFRNSEAFITLTPDEHRVKCLTTHMYIKTLIKQILEEKAMPLKQLSLTQI